MDTSQDQSLQLQQSQLQKIAPHLIQASEILQCTSLELRQTIERELMENPALESIEGTVSDRCADCELPASLCTNCPYAESRSAASDSAPNVISSETEADGRSGDDSPQETPIAEQQREDNEYEPDIDPDYDMSSLMAMSETSDPYIKELAIEDAYDPLSLAPSLPSLRDHLLSRLRSMVSGPNDKVCEYLVNSLDERGWLRLDRVEAMVALSITEETLDRMIAALQACDPPGIGARDLRECLLIQLQLLEDEGAGNALAKTIVRNHWELLTQRRFDHLVRRTGATRAAVTAAVQFIQSELSPAPAGSFREPWDYKPDSKSEAVKPDVIIRRSDTGFEIEITGLELPTLHINARYRRMYEAIRLQKSEPHAQVGVAARPITSRAAAANRISAQERKHIALYVERANLFLKNIQQRRKTIERITRCLIEAQQGFIETGSRGFLIPLTRTELAQRAGLHESTVSRALLRKFVQLPSQDVISFDAFFAPAGSIKDMIAGLIATEDRDNPFSDEALRQKLDEAGISVARRTIVKYRESLRIPASYLRRQH